MRRHLPNQLTLLRLVLAAVFFVVLNQYRHPAGPDWAILTAIVVFVLASITDWLDGYLARRWHVESTFGRIMDPFCDKVLVLGAFIYLAGPRFVDPQAAAHRHTLNMATGVYPWMVALMLARELLVTGIRDEFESRGVKFGAKFVGKLKTTIQLVAVPIALLIVHLGPNPATALFRDLGMHLVVLVTVVSGIPYVISACKTKI